jgi:hypothetical protein
MRFRHAITSTLLALYLCQTTVGQIFSIRGNDILNAPYRGTIDSLRQATMDIGYGEVGTFVEPTSNSQIQAEPPILIWHDPTPGIDDPWDRSVLRLYNGLDASGDEIDLSGHTSVSNALELPYEGYKRLSFKAVGGLGGGAIAQATQLQIAGFGLQTAARIAPANRTTQVIFLRAGLAIERPQFGLNSAAAAQRLGAAAAVSGVGESLPH